MTWKDYEKLFRHGRRGWGCPFTENVENVCIIPILVSNKLWVGT